METLNFTSLLEILSLSRIIGMLQIQTAFMKYTASRTGVSVIVQRKYVDTETGEVFKVARGLRGLRLFIISKLV